MEWTVSCLFVSDCLGLGPPALDTGRVRGKRTWNAVISCVIVFAGRCIRSSTLCPSSLSSLTICLGYRVVYLPPFPLPASSLFFAASSCYEMLLASNERMNESCTTSLCTSLFASSPLLYISVSSCPSMRYRTSVIFSPFLPEFNALGFMFVVCYLRATAATSTGTVLPPFHVSCCPFRSCIEALNLRPLPLRRSSSLLPIYLFASAFFI